MRSLFALAFLMATQAHGYEVERNKIDDRFVSSSVEGSQAVLTGTPKSLKPGDNLYFRRSPFQFRVIEVKGDKVTIALPERHDLTKGEALMRFPSASIQKSIDTEAKLKRALEE